MDDEMRELLKNMHQLNAIQPHIADKLHDLTTGLDRANRRIEVVDKELNLKANELKIYFSFIEKFKGSAEDDQGFPWCKRHNEQLKDLDEKVTWMKRLFTTTIIAVLCKVVYDVWLK